VKNKAWQPWIAIYTDAPDYSSDIFVLRAIAKYNEGGDPEDVKIRNGLWSDWDNNPLMPYTDIELRCQASPLDRDEYPKLIRPYAYSVGVGEVYPHMDLRRMEKQIKVLRKFAKGYRYGRATAQMDSFVKWVAAITEFADFMKAQGFVLSKGRGMGSWDDTPKSDLLLFDAESPLHIYNYVRDMVRSNGFEIEWQTEEA